MIFTTAGSLNVRSDVDPPAEGVCHFGQKTDVFDRSTSGAAERLGSSVFMKLTTDYEYFERGLRE